MRGEVAKLPYWRPNIYNHTRLEFLEEARPRVWEGSSLFGWMQHRRLRGSRWTGMCLLEIFGHKDHALGFGSNVQQGSPVPRS